MESQTCQYRESKYHNCLTGVGEVQHNTLTKCSNVLLQSATKSKISSPVQCCNGYGTQKYMYLNSLMWNKLPFPLKYWLWTVTAATTSSSLNSWTSILVDYFVHLPITGIENLIEENQQTLTICLMCVCTEKLFLQRLARSPIHGWVSSVSFPSL